MGTPFVYAPYVCWNIGEQKNAIPIVHSCHRLSEMVTSCLFPRDQVSHDRFRKPTLKIEFSLNIFIEFAEFSD